MHTHTYELDQSSSQLRFASELLFPDSQAAVLLQRMFLPYIFWLIGDTSLSALPHALLLSRTRSPSASLTDRLPVPLCQSECLCLSVSTSPVGASTKAWLRRGRGAALTSLTGSPWRCCPWWPYRSEQVQFSCLPKSLSCQDFIVCLHPQLIHQSWHIWTPEPLYNWRLLWCDLRVEDGKPPPYLLTFGAGHDLLSLRIASLVGPSSLSTTLIFKYVLSNESCW